MVHRGSGNPHQKYSVFSINFPKAALVRNVNPLYQSVCAAIVKFVENLMQAECAYQPHGRFRGVILGPGFVPSHPSLRKIEGKGIRLVA